MIESLIRKKRLIASRVRARSWATRGATVASKVSVGARCRVDEPGGVTLETRVTLEADVWLKLVDRYASLKIGEFSFLGRGTELDIADNVRIGSKVLIAPRVFITDHSHNAEPGLGISDQGCSSKSTAIGNDVWIGTGATILPGVQIGDGAVIGAGAVVRHDIPPNEVWAGVPARKIRDR